MKQLSVIIPIYNAERTLARTLDSVLSQKVDIEIILVNDGSTDGSESICLNYQKKYPKIINYLKFSNHGQGASRNQGLKIAKGEFVSFVDADDYIEPNMYQKMYSSKYDLITCNHSMLKNSRIKEKNYYKDKTIDINKNFILSFDGPCNMIIKRAFINKIGFKFSEKIIFEDFAIIPAIGFYQPKLKHIDRGFYVYDISNQSTTRNNNYNPKNKDIIEATKQLIKNAKKSGKYQLYYSELEYSIIRHSLISSALRVIRFRDPENIINKTFKIVNKEFPNWSQNKYLKNGPRKYKIIAFLINHKLFRTLYILEKINQIIKRFKND